jgi:hypothetical protein
MRYRPASNRPGRNRPCEGELTAKFGVFAADGVFDLGGCAGEGDTASRVIIWSASRAAPQSEQKWLAPEMSEPQVAQIGMAQTEIFRFGVLMTSQRKSLCYQTRGKLSCLPDSNLPRLSGVGYPPANRGPVRGDPCSSKHNSCKLYARSSRARGRKIRDSLALDGSAK